jgi:hypothetical protein
MKGSNVMKECELCKKGSLKLKKVTNFPYRTPMGIVTIEGESEIEECPSCKEIFISGELIDSWNRLILERLSKKEGLLTPEELQFIFSVLPYTQQELAQSTGRERSTLTKYKTGENPVDPLFVDTLQAVIQDYLAGNEKTLIRLRKRIEFRFAEEKIRKLKVG